MSGRVTFVALPSQSGTVPCDVVWPDDDEWEPVYSRRWLRIVGLVVVVALILPAVYVALTRWGLL